jgi:hypothetical protein
MTGHGGGQGDSEGSRRAGVALVALVALVAPALAGCIAVPFALPPSKVQIGAGTRSVARPGHDETDVPLQVRAGLSPLGLSPDMLDRRIDVGVGYLLETGKATRIQGGYLDAGGVLGRWPLGDGGLFRAMTSVQLRLLAEQDGMQLGRGGAVQLGGELVTFKQGAFSSSSHRGGAFGVDYGEGGFGLYLEAAYAQIGSTTIQSASLGLTIRLPGAAGVLYAWGLPGDGSANSKSSSSPSSSSSSPPSGGPSAAPGPARR